MRNWILFACASLLLLLSFGCISSGSISDSDRLNSKMEFDLSDFLSGMQKPIGGDTPCSCLVCTSERGGFWEQLFGVSRDKEDALANSQCNFLSCNASNYEQIIQEYDSKSQEWSLCKKLNANTGDYETKICAPRFFMIGGGVSSAEFSMAQRYCAGELTLPVIWTTPQENSHPKTPEPQTLMCHLAKSQMPIVVWNSQGKYMAHSSYSQMLKSFNSVYEGNKISGPIMVTTEALADPYLNSEETGGKKILNISMLEAAKAQIEAIKRDCPDCLSVLALKPTFDEKGLPDLCPLDYFFAYRPQEESNDADGLPITDPLNCADKYPPSSSYLSRPALNSPSFGTKIDLVGIAFSANENTNLTTCSPQKSIAQHLLYSKQSLNNFYTPSVWYSIAISDGPTLTPTCAFSKESVSKAYYDLMRGTSGFVASGIIGIAPHRLIDSPLSGSLECKAQTSVGSLLDISSLDQITAGTSLEVDVGKNPNSIPIPLLLEDGKIPVSNVLQKEENKLIFQDLAGRTFLAYSIGPIITINWTGCQYGLIGMDGVAKNESHFSWFSSCQYYYTDRGPLFSVSSPQSPKQILSGTELSSQDGLFTLFVEEVNSASDSEAVFFASHGQILGKFFARKDGNSITIYDMPQSPSSQQPIMFSINGAGGQCAVFDSSKMFFRSSTAQIRPQGAPAVEIPQDEETTKQISQSMCGACLSPAPMPEAFCEWKGRYSFNKDACNIYPEMDLAFLKQNLDPIFMRSIAVAESGLGASSRPVSGVGSSACATSGNEKDTDSSRAACMRGDKSPQTISTLTSKYCTSSDISRELSIDGIPPRVACGLGVFQCIDGPRSDYNPFNPYDSATCGVREFLGSDGGNRFLGMRNLVISLRQSNTYLASEIKSSEIDWYAAWLAAYGYRGISVPKDELRSYAPKDSSDNFVKFVVNLLRQKGAVEPEYGVKWVTIYNDGISECDSGCQYQSC